MNNFQKYMYDNILNEISVIYRTEPTKDLDVNAVKRWKTVGPFCQNGFGGDDGVNSGVKELVKKR